MKVKSFRNELQEGDSYIWLLRTASSCSSISLCVPFVNWRHTIHISVCSYSVRMSVCLYKSDLKLFISFHKLNEECWRSVYSIPVALWEIVLLNFILIWPNIMQMRLNLTETAWHKGKININLNELLQKSWKANCCLEI